MLRLAELPLTLVDRTGAPFTVRAYAGADRAALEAMYAAFRPQRAAQGLPPADDAARRRWLERVLRRGEHFVVEISGRVLGHAMLMPLADGGRELANFVHQSIRNRGIGTILNTVVVAAARTAGAPRVWLSVEPSNTAAIRSYEKAGFRRLPGSLWAPELEMVVEFTAGPD